ncbi:MAG: glycosyltransferase family 4 protein, partial [Anaerolineae bacterium]|nr:glycosyltransferase family 4 protein [Anaerolineae bacterium]
FGLEPFTNAKAKQIAGMPDALALDHPELFSAVDLAYRQQVYGQLKQAARVVTLSEHARERLLHHTELRLEQIAVVPLGAEPQKQLSVNTNANEPPEPLPQPSPVNEGGSQTEYLLNYHPLPARYVFYPANFWPHKRHDLLFRIMSRLWQEQPDSHLVMTGGRSEADRRGLQVLATRYGCPPERIHDLGYVDDAQLTLIYRKAEALVFVSQYEGFGMPLLEAMQQGCPVICAPLAAIPEVVGEAGIIVNSEDAEDWVKAILTVLPEQRDKLIAAGRERAAQFTWAKTRDGWREVIAEAGLDCGGASVQSKNESTEIAGHIQPLLTQISQHAASMGRSRWRQMAGLPLVMLLQMRVLELARQYRRTAG